MAWPRAEVYGSDWYLQYFALLLLGGVLVVGTIAYLLRSRAISTDDIGEELAPEPAVG
jgi:hypothetical protein